MNVSTFIVCKIFEKSNKCIKKLIKLIRCIRACLAHTDVLLDDILVGVFYMLKNNSQSPRIPTNKYQGLKFSQTIPLKI